MKNTIGGCIGQILNSLVPNIAPDVVAMVEAKFKKAGQPGLINNFGVIYVLDRHMFVSWLKSLKGRTYLSTFGRLHRPPRCRDCGTRLKTSHYLCDTCDLQRRIQAFNFCMKLSA